MDECYIVELLPRVVYRTLSGVSKELGVSFSALRALMRGEEECEVSGVKISRGVIKVVGKTVEREKGERGGVGSSVLSVCRGPRVGGRKGAMDGRDGDRDRDGARARDRKDGARTWSGPMGCSG